MIVNAENKVLGRLASNVARSVKEGEEVVIVNADKAVISGDERQIKEDYKKKYDRGTRHDGPYYPKAPHMIVKRTVRGMLPDTTSEGQKSVERVKAYLGVPIEFEDDVEELEVKEGDDLKQRNYVKLSEVSRFMGWTPRGDLE